MRLEDSITNVKGIGDKTAAAFAELNIYTISDLLYHFPREYQTYKPVEAVNCARENYQISVCGRICGNLNLVNANGKQVITARLMDATGSIMLRWFNMPYIRNMIKAGDVFVIHGKVRLNGKSFCIDQGEYFTPGEYQQKLVCLKSIYPLTRGITNNLIERSIKQVLADPEIIDELVYDVFTPNMIRKYNLCTLKESLYGIHVPYNIDEMKMARKRLAFEEFVLFMLSFRYNRELSLKEPNKFLITETGYVSVILNSLPYELTNAQKRVWDEIEEDLCGNYLMNRLVQGDVGSGKTIVALLAMVKIAQNHGQSALMAPTEVLAFQHYSKITSIIKKSGLPVKTVLLTGSMKGFERSTTLDKIERGEADIIIGTHAIFQESVNYSNLVLCITDEQHRFGVRQREALKNKGINSHVLVMSATPIPRTLAMIIYGDLDISIMDELPVNRLPVKNCVVGTSYRPSAYRFLQKQVDEGRQCYIICPMVEANDSVDGEDVISYCAKLKKIMPSYISIEYLHGRMKPEQKTAVMTAFANGEIDILVSTTVIEVGVDVKNATVMMIENAERFGLSALHQLRGRVGRGPCQSYCIFIDGNNKPESSERLNILLKSNDGFYIANEDLRLRGPGEFLGIKQSGQLNLKIADVYQDSDILQKASVCVDEILEKDPGLNLFENSKLRNSLYQFINKDIIL